MKLCYLSRYIEVTWTGLRINVSLTVAPLWVQLKEMLLLALMGKKGGGFVLRQRLKGGFERLGLLASLVGLFVGRLGCL